jgi:hypothetical protein
LFAGNTTGQSVTRSNRIKRRHKGLPNIHIKRPDLHKETEEEEHEDEIESYEFSNEEVKKLFEKFDVGVKKINDQIWTKLIKDGFSYYSPEKVFMYAMLYNPDGN